MNNDYKDENIWLMQGDCLERMKEIPDGSVDLVLTDPPFGTTQNKWDCLIPFEELWDQYNRIAKYNAAFVLFGAQPFTSLLVCSNIENFKYDWTWNKPKGTGHLNAKKQPMRDKEDIVVFYRKQCTYNPQKTPGKPYKGSGGASKNDNYGGFAAVREGSPDGSRYPRSVLRFQHETAPVHPTQKPVALMEYLIRTYTNEGETVLDNCVGSGTTGVACRNLNRKFIGVEMDENYFNIAKQRIIGEKN